jgi:hypothetical protein
MGMVSFKPWLLPHPPALSHCPIPQNQKAVLARLLYTVCLVNMNETDLLAKQYQHVFSKIKS